MKQSLILLISAVIIITLLIVDFKQPKNVTSPSEPLLRRKIQILELALAQSARERVANNRYNDSLNRVNNSLVQMNSKYDSILAKVNGSYNKLKPTELGQEMIRRYNAR